MANIYRVLTGPTAAGKTAWLLNLAQHTDFDLNVISADSRQVYRNMDIGTGKPVQAERLILPHYAIDFLEPGIIFSVYQYLTIAAAALRVTREQGRQAWVCGGTGLYIRSLVQGLDLGAIPRPRLRAALEQQLAVHPPRELSAGLGLKLPDPANPRRVLRAAERACEEPGRAAQIYAALKLDPGLAQADMEQDGYAPGIAAARAELAQWRCGGIAVLDPGREQLWRMIETRVRGMFDTGLVDEVAHIRRLGYGAAEVVAQGIGYREAGLVLDGVLDTAQAVEQTVVRTRQYAKRQRTYFRGMGWPVVPREDLPGFFGLHLPPGPAWL